MAYEFLKKFYDFMESRQGVGEKASLYVFSPLSDAKYIKRYVDPETGEKKANPLLGKIYKNQGVTFVYGESYAEKMKAINPDWVPSGTTKYEPVDGNPLLKYCPSTETYSVGIVEPETFDSQYLYYDNSTEEIKPWDNVKLGDVRNYIHPSYPSGAAVRYQHFNADSIYRITSGQSFMNDDFKYKDLLTILF